MADWVIGDLHGCADEFSALLGHIGFDTTTDSLWLTGDLINRGPRCLDTLRHVYQLHGELGNRLQVVLGNHDLHLLACWLGVRAPSADDTLDSVLSATDSDALCQWLRQQPLVHQCGKDILVHAGLYPALNLEANLELAKGLHAQLAGDHPRAILEHLYATGKPTLQPDSPLETQTAFAAAAFTRMRCLNPDMTLNSREKGEPSALPDGVTPWYTHASTHFASYQIHTGHWAALGYGVHGPVVALDGGCVWGGDLVAVRRDTPQQPYRVRRGSVDARH